MDDKELYAEFSKEESETYAKEAQERWGYTNAYIQSQERVKRLTKEDWNRIRNESDEILKKIVENMNKGSQSCEVQALIDKHYASLKTFYEPSLEMYRGLANMYVDDIRFRAYYEKYHKDLPGFMRDAMHIHCDTHV